MPFSKHFEEAIRFRAARILYRTGVTNPVRHAISKAEERSPASYIKQKLSDIVDLQPPMEIQRLKPPWAPGNDPDPSLKRYWEIRSIIRKHALTEWQAHADNPEVMTRFKARTGTAVKCSTRLRTLPLAFAMTKRPRWALSWVAQFRSGDALVGEWFQKFNVEEAEYKCRCNTDPNDATPETIDHILKACELYASSRDILRAASPTLDDTVLLGTKDGLTAVAEFVTAALHER